MEEADSHTVQLEKVIKELQQVAKQLKLQNILSKEILDISEASCYLNLSTSTLYKLTSSSQLIHFKPNGKKVYFRKKDLDCWGLFKLDPITQQELEQAGDNAKTLLSNID